MIHKSVTGPPGLTREVLMCTSKSQHVPCLDDNGHDSISICHLMCWIFVLLSSIHHSSWIRMYTYQLNVPKDIYLPCHLLEVAGNCTGNTPSVCTGLQRRAGLQSPSRTHGKMPLGLWFWHLFQEPAATTGLHRPTFTAINLFLYSCCSLKQWQREGASY